MLYFQLFAIQWMGQWKMKNDLIRWNCGRDNYSIIFNIIIMCRNNYHLLRLIKRKNYYLVEIIGSCWWGTRSDSLHFNLQLITICRIVEQIIHYINLLTLILNLSSISLIKNISSQLFWMCSKALVIFLSFLWPSVTIFLNAISRVIIFATLLHIINVF